jgi:hypothetical protein
LIGAIGAATVTAYLAEGGRLGHYLTMAIQEVTAIDQVGTDLYALVKFIGITKNGNSKSEVVDYLLAVSHDGGLVWTFLPAGFSQSMKVVQAAPALKTTLTISAANTTTQKK